MKVEEGLGRAAHALKKGNNEQAVAYLMAAVKAMDAREERRATYAHRLIAENMFAIVRLEIAQATDQVINNALLVKRDRTGSGSAAFALNVTGTLVMLAGNVLSGGGMSLLGNLLVAAGEMAQAAASNDAAGMAGGVTHMASGIVGTSTNQGRGEMSNQLGGGYQWQQTSDVDNGQVETRSRTDGISELISTVGDGVVEVGGQFYERFKTDEPDNDGYKVVKKKTAWIKHGAGGTNAITYDVQEAMTAAYEAGLNQISQELRAIGRTDRKVRLGKSSILGPMLATEMDAKATLHPMTVWVIKRAINNLARSGGGRYQALTGGSGTFGRTSVTNRAKRDVKEAYAFMEHSDDGYLTEVDVIRAHIKRKFA